MLILIIVAAGIVIGYFQNAESLLDYLKPIIAAVVLGSVYLFDMSN